MRKLAFVIAAGALLALPLPASAAGPMTDVSAQSIEVGPGGVRVGHSRWDSRRDHRRRDRVIIRERRHDRFESRGGGCRTVTVRERLPGGGVKIVKRRDC